MSDTTEATAVLQHHTCAQCSASAGRMLLQPCYVLLDVMSRACAGTCSTCSASCSGRNAARSGAQFCQACFFSAVSGSFVHADVQCASCPQGVHAVAVCMQHATRLTRAHLPMQPHVLQGAPPAGTDDSQPQAAALACGRPSPHQMLDLRTQNAACDSPGVVPFSAGGVTE